MRFKFFSNLLSVFTIRQKLWGGFTGMLLVLATIVFITLSNITKTQNKVAEMSNDIQPAVALLMRAQTQIKQAIASLGFFLLTKEEIHKTRYQNYLYAIKSTLDELKNTRLAKDDENTKQLVPEIEQLVKGFTSYDKELFELTSDHNKNYRAIEFSNEKLNPVDRELSQALSKMILSEKGEPLSEKRKQLLSLLNDLRYFWSNVIHHASVFLTHGNEEALDNVNQYRSKSEELIGRIQIDYSDILNLEESGTLPVVNNLYRQWNKQFDNFQKNYGSNNTRADVALISDKIFPILRKIDQRLSNLLRQFRGILDDTSNELISQATSTTKLVSILSLTGATVFLLLFWILSCVITTPINEAVEAMDDIAMGYGDLTRRLASSGRDELSVLSNGFNSFVEKVQEIIVEVRHSSEELTRSAQDMANDAKDASDTVQRQKLETDHIASAITEMSITSQEVLKNVVTVSDATKNVSDETQLGRKIFAGTIESVQHLNRETQSLTKLMETLGKEIQEIGTVLDVIQNITEQTNLLALNAAIEAARAGDHGRGFSVVADEVRALAMQTTKSTQEIKSKIDSIQNESQLVMERTGKNHEIAQSSAQLALDAEKSLELIAVAVADATDKASQIASMAHEQSAVAEELSKNVENISTMADHTSQVAEKVFNDSERQRSLSESVQTLLSRFKT